MDLCRELHSTSRTVGTSVAPKIDSGPGKLVKKTVPYVIIGSPQCTLFCNWQEPNKYVHRDDPEWLRALDDEKRKVAQHVEFCVALYWHQLRHGLHFIDGHPWGANS